MKKKKKPETQAKLQGRNLALQEKKERYNFNFITIFFIILIFCQFINFLLLILVII